MTAEVGDMVVQRYGKFNIGFYLASYGVVKEIAPGDDGAILALIMVNDWLFARPVAELVVAAKACHEHMKNEGGAFSEYKEQEEKIERMRKVPRLYVMSSKEDLASLGWIGVDGKVEGLPSPPGFRVITRAIQRKRSLWEGISHRSFAVSEPHGDENFNGGRYETSYQSKAL